MPNAKWSMPQLLSETRLPSLVVREFGAHHVTLTLARPDVHNALDAALVELLITVLQSLKAPVCTVLLEGEGASFCAGADLRGWDPTQQDKPVSADSLAQLLQLMRTTKPVFVSKVQGVAAAGGAGLAAASDIIIASEHARFSFPEVRLGLVPAVISPYVERALGAMRTRYLFLTAAQMSAQEALAAGFVQQVVDAPALDEAVVRVLQAVWRAGPEALAECKWLLDDLAGKSHEERMRRCQQTLTRVRRSEEAAEGIRSFFARDKPRWRLS